MTRDVFSPILCSLCIKTIDLAMPAKRQKITFEDIVECFKYKETEAAQRLGISKTKLKRLCRQYGTPR